MWRLLNFISMEQQIDRKYVIVNIHAFKQQVERVHITYNPDRYIKKHSLIYNEPGSFSAIEPDTS